MQRFHHPGFARPALALTLVGTGILFLVHRQFGLEWSMLWPLGIVISGALLLIHPRRHAQP